MIMHTIVQTIFLLTGITAVAAALFNWEWFFTADNAKFLVKRLGINGARWAYGIIGLTFITSAIYFYYRIEAI